MATIVVNDNLLKSIKEIAKMKNTTEINVINDYLEKCVNNDIKEYSHENCEALHEKWDKIAKNMADGDEVELDVGKFFKH